MARSKRYVKQLQNKAAQEVAWTVILGMTLGYFDSIPVKERSFLSEPMQKWATLATELGELKSE